MPAAPSFADLAASGNLKGTVRPALGALRAYTTGVLAVDGTIATALATLGALGGQYLLRTTAYSVTSADRGRVIDTTGTWTLSLLAAASAVTASTVSDPFGSIVIVPAPRLRSTKLNPAPALAAASKVSVHVPVVSITRPRSAAATA